MTDRYLQDESDYVTLGHPPVRFYANYLETDYRSKWDNKGHQMMFCYATFPRRDVVYINIPKVASSSLKTAFTANKWDIRHRVDLVKESEPEQRTVHGYDIKYIVVLRDPLSRWISGIVEYLFAYHAHTAETWAKDPMGIGVSNLHTNQLAVELLIDRCVFDDHSDLQCSFIDQLPWDQCYFFRMEDDLETKINKFLTEKCINYFKKPRQRPIKLERENVTDPNSSDVVMRQKALVQKTVSRLLEANQTYMDRVNDYLAPDYELIKRVSFQ